MAAKRKKESYEIGFGKPPKQSQFKKGQSGNRKGRPKRSQRAADLFLNAMLQKISVNENGTRRSMTKLEAALTQAVNKAVAGNPRAMQTLTQMLKTFGFLNHAQATQPLVITANIPLPSHLQTAEDIEKFKAQEWMKPRKYYGGDDSE